VSVSWHQRDGREVRQLRSVDKAGCVIKSAVWACVETIRSHSKDPCNQRGYEGKDHEGQYEDDPYLCGGPHLGVYLPPTYHLHLMNAT